MFHFRPNGLQIAMILTFEIFGRGGNHGKKFPKLGQTSFSDIVHYELTKGSELQLCFACWWYYQLQPRTQKQSRKRPIQIICSIGQRGQHRSMAIEEGISWP